MRILAVDDDPIILELLVQLLLDTAEHDVIAAFSTGAALELVDDETTPAFDAVLLDIDKAGADGIGLLSQLRGRPAYRDKPILMLTAKSAKHQIDAAFAAGATDFITKPFEISALKGRLALLERQSASAERAVSTLSSPITLDTALPVFDVAHVVSEAALVNYAKQLSRSALFGSSAFAIAIRDIETLHATLSPFAFHCLITDVAEVIADAVSDCQNLISYVGSGVFVGIADRAWQPQTEKLMMQINMDLAVAGLSDDEGAPIHVRVNAGQSIRLTWKSGRSVLDALAMARRCAERARDTFVPFFEDSVLMDRTA